MANEHPDAQADLALLKKAIASIDPKVVAETVGDAFKDSVDFWKTGFSFLPRDDVHNVISEAQAHAVTHAHVRE